MPAHEERPRLWSGSGLVGLNADYLSKSTVEGYNWIITQQVAAYLIKKMESESCMNDSDMPPIDATDALFRTYLDGRDPQSYLASSMGHYLRCKQSSSSRSPNYSAYRALIVEKKPWTKLMIQLHQSSRAHREQILLTNFHTSFSTSTPASSPLSSPTPEVPKTYFRLHALSTPEQSAHPSTLTNSLPQDRLSALPDTILDLKRALRPHAVTLVDA